MTEQALDENGIKFAEIHGSKSVTARMHALNTFKTDPDVRVLLLSGVGTSGLNIAFANILVIVVRIAHWLPFAHV